MNNTEIIDKLRIVRSAVQTMQNVPVTEHNCNVVLGSIQIIDSVIGELQERGIVRGGQENQR